MSEDEEEEGRPWASGEGYSPLIGSNFNMMAMVYGDNQSDSENDGLESNFVMMNDEVTQYGGAFARESADASEDKLPHFDDLNYATVADRALAALEADYLATLRLESGPRSGDQTQNETLVQIPASSIDPDERQQPEEETSSSLINDFSPESKDLANLFPDAPIMRDSTVIVDVEKVRKVVGSIHTNNTKLKTNYETWDLDQKEKAARESISRAQNALIPKGPLRAFLKDTMKAKEITHTLSRSATIAEALVRLNVLGAKVFEDSWSLNIHVIGCDQVECETDDRIRAFFQPLARWIGGQSRSPTSMHLSLVGPGIIARGSGFVDLLSTNFDRLKCAEASYHSALYEEWLPSQIEQPDIVVAFNAGIWGYSDWCATIRTIAERRLQVPFVVTAYTLQEAEDDYDILEDEIAKALAYSKEKTSLCCIWEPEVNPFSSKIDRPTQSAPEGRRYRENQAWQAWRL